MGFRIDRTRLLHSSLFLRGQCYLYRPCDLFCHDALQCKDVFELALVALGPEVFFG